MRDGKISLFWGKKGLTNSVPLFQKTLTNIGRAQNNQSVLRALKALTETFGLDYIYITQFVNPTRGVPDAWLRIHNWPSQLIQERIGKNVFKKDPLYRKAIKAHLPFSWQEARDEADPEGLEVLKQAEKYGLIEGWLIPIRSDDLPVGGVSLGGAVCTATSEDLEMICEAATHAYTRIFVLSGKSKTPPVERLSQREAEILTLIAEGCKKRRGRPNTRHWPRRNQRCPYALLSKTWRQQSRRCRGASLTIWSNISVYGHTHTNRVVPI